MFLQALKLVDLKTVLKFHTWRLVHRLESFCGIAWNCRITGKTPVITALKTSDFPAKLLMFWVSYVRIPGNGQSTVI